MVDWSDLNENRVNAIKAADGGLAGFSVVWPNILWVAEMFWRAQESSDYDRRAETWHHLVMSAGNFKRQGGTQICLFQAAPDDHLRPDGNDRPPFCNVKTLTGEVELVRDDARTWKHLTDDKTSVKGIQVATATTILSALWPGNHFIADIRDLRATIALNLADVVMDGWVDPDSRKDETVTWGWYEWLRGKLLAKAAKLQLVDPEISGVDVERALYSLDGQVKRPENDQPRFSWSEYAEALGAELAGVAPAP